MVADDGIVPLTPDDLRQLSREDDESDSSDETLVDAAEFPRRCVSGFTKRVTLNNVAESRSFQVNAPIGEDIYKDVDCVIIKNNKAGSQAMQINYALDYELALRMLDIQGKMAAM